jgi:protein gp37
MSTKISWTDEVWNVVTGCTHSGMPGCDNCYARRLFPRVYGGDMIPCTSAEATQRAEGSGQLTVDIGVDAFLRPRNFSDVRTHPDRLSEPLRRRKPTKFFACSMGDLFHRDVPDEFIAAVFGVMAACPQHTFQVLTKRPERARLLMQNDSFRGQASYEAWLRLKMREGEYERTLYSWPLPNVWPGASASTQADLERVMQDLPHVPATVRFLSLEPLLAEIDVIGCVFDVDWVIVGCESGPNRRPMKIEWARSIAEQCRAAGVAVFYKQIDIDGRVSKDMSEWPEDLRVREFPPPRNRGG